jgi:hypothetical protein
MDGAQHDIYSSDLESKAIAFDELLVADTILVRTRKSNYQFFVSDPSSLKGTLTGGFLGDQTAGAILSGAMTADKTGFDAAGLKTGSRAVFFVEAKEGVHRVVTSVVTDLAQAKRYVNDNRAA